MMLEEIYEVQSEKIKQKNMLLRGSRVASENLLMKFWLTDEVLIN